MRIVIDIVDMRTGLKSQSTDRNKIYKSLGYTIRNLKVSHENVDDDAAIDAAVAASPLLPKYGTPIDRESAREILTARMNAANEAAAAEEAALAKAAPRKNSSPIPAVIWESGGIVAGDSRECQCLT